MNDPLAAEISERQNAAAAAPLHQRRDRARQRDERVGADIERDPKSVARRLHEWIRQVGRRRERGAVNEEIEAAELAVELAASVVDLLIARDVTRKHERIVELRRPARERSPRAARSDRSARGARPPQLPPARSPTKSIACWPRQQSARVCQTRSDMFRWSRRLVEPTPRATSIACGRRRRGGSTSAAGCHRGAACRRRSRRVRRRPCCRRIDCPETLAAAAALMTRTEPIRSAARLADREVGARDAPAAAALPDVEATRESADDGPGPRHIRRRSSSSSSWHFRAVRCRWC